jgi:hypothetical protein
VSTIYEMISDREMSCVNTVKKLKCRLLTGKRHNRQERQLSIKSHWFFSILIPFFELISCLEAPPWSQNTTEVLRMSVRPVQTKRLRIMYDCIYAASTQHSVSHVSHPPVSGWYNSYRGPLSTILTKRDILRFTNCHKNYLAWKETVLIRLRRS